MSLDTPVTSIGSTPVVGSGGYVPGGPAVAATSGNGPAAAVAPVAATAGSADVLQRAAAEVVQAMPGPSRFSINYDKQAGMTVVRVYNSNTGELVRQIPGEEVVHLAQLMRQEEANPKILDVTA